MQDHVHQENALYDWTKQTSSAGACEEQKTVHPTLLENIY